MIWGCRPSFCSSFSWLPYACSSYSWSAANAGSPHCLVDEQIINLSAAQTSNRVDDRRERPLLLAEPLSSPEPAVHRSSPAPQHLPASRTTVDSSRRTAAGFRRPAEKENLLGKRTDGGDLAARARRFKAAIGGREKVEESALVLGKLLRFLGQYHGVSLESLLGALDEDRDLSVGALRVRLCNSTVVKGVLGDAMISLPD